MKLFLVTLLLLMPIILSSCAPTKYSHVNILANTKSMQSGKFVDNVWINQEKIATDEPFIISLAQVNIDSISDEKGITKEECKKKLTQYVLNSQFNPGIILAKDDTLKYRIKLAITNMSPGDRASRIWAAELGFGHANVEIQAIIINLRNELIAEIKDSRNSSGAIGFRDNVHDAGPELVDELLQQISENILQELQEIKAKYKSR